MKTLKINLSSLLSAADDIADIVCHNEERIDTSYGTKTRKGITDIIVRKVSEGCYTYDEVMRVIN